MLLLLAAGCTSSRITSSWKDKGVVQYKYNKIMVLGLIRETDRSMQMDMENHFAGDLKDLGYNAVSSLSEYGPKAFDNMTEAAALDKLQHSGVDAVITIVLLDKHKESRYVPGNMNYTPYRSNYNRFWGYRRTLYDRIYEPGYYVTDTKYFWESNLYEMNTQKLLYSVQTESFDPANSESLAHEYGMLIVENMVKQKVLVKHISPFGEGN
jgi:hypothetical protein